MGHCAGLGVLLLQPVESWQGVQALASASHVAGWLLASSWHFGVGLQPCLPHGCLLAGAGSCWRESGRCPAGTGVLAKPWRFMLGLPGLGTATMACTQPKEGSTYLCGRVGGTVCLAGCPGKVLPLQMMFPPSSLVSAGNC